MMHKRAGSSFAGAANNNAKLTEEQVAEIRERYGPLRGVGKHGQPTLAQLARRYGVSQSTIWNVVARRKWTHT